MTRRRKWFIGGGIALSALAALIYLTPAPQVTVRNRSGWPVGVSSLNGIGNLGGGVAPSLSKPQIISGLPTPKAQTFGFAPIGGYKLLARYHLVFKDKQGHIVADRWTPSDKQISMWQGLENLLSPSDALAAACTACTTTVGANRLLGIFEGGVNVTSESEGNTGASSPFSGTVNAPMIVPGTAIFAINGITGSCTDNGNGTCSGANYTTSTSTINYDTGAYTLTYTSNPGSGHAVTVSYKQYENWTSCSLAQIAATGQGCWFVGLMAGNASATLNTTDTMGSHSGWSEVTLNSNANGGVTQTSRPIWTGTGAPSSGSDTNGASQVVYNSGTTAWSGSTADVTGIFLVDNSGSVSTTAGTLDGEQSLSPVQPIGAQYTINITAQLSISPG